MNAPSITAHSHRRRQYTRRGQAGIETSEEREAKRNSKLQAETNGPDGSHAYTTGKSHTHSQQESSLIKEHHQTSKRYTSQAQYAANTDPHAASHCQPRPKPDGTQDDSDKASQWDHACTHKSQQALYKGTQVQTGTRSSWGQA